MSMNGNRFKPRTGLAVCPDCKGYPPLLNVDGRFVPTCATCDGRGRFPAPASEGEQINHRPNAL